MSAQPHRVLRPQCALMLCFVACTDARMALTVDMITDLVPGTDYVGTIVRLAGTDRPEQSTAAWLAQVHEGYRIARFDELEPGPVEVEVEVLGAGGDIVYRRTIIVDLDESEGVTIAVTRSCRDVPCPTGLACLGGTCGDASCTVETPELCPEPACQSNDDCVAAGPCALECRLSMCLASIADGCREDEWCHPDAGCVPRLASTEARVSVEVDGDGRVHSQHGSCEPRSSCDLTVPVGTVLRLDAEPLGTNELFGWLPSTRRVACGSGGSCEIHVFFSFGIRALFAPSRYDVAPRTLTVAGEPLDMMIRGLAYDSAGRLYASDTETDSIWRVADNGALERYAGSESAGRDEGPVEALQAHFADPAGLAFDDAGNLYVADSANNVVRVVGADGIVRDFAGSGEAGALDGPRLEARLTSPVYLAWSQARQTLLVSGGPNHMRTVRDGMVETPGGGILPGAAAAPTIDDDGTILWSTNEGILRLAEGSSAAELHIERPCRRGWSYTFHLRWHPDGSLFETGSGTGVCEISADGEHRELLLPGSLTDGPDYEARSPGSSWAFAVSAAREIALVDLHPGVNLRVMTPR